MKKKKYRITWNEGLQPATDRTAVTADVYATTGRMGTNGFAEQKASYPGNRASIDRAMDGGDSPGDRDAALFPGQAFPRKPVPGGETGTCTAGGPDFSGTEPLPSGTPRWTDRTTDRLRSGAPNSESVADIRGTVGGSVILHPFDPQQVTARSEFTAATTGQYSAGYPGNPQPAGGIDRDDVQGMIDRKLAGLRVYVLESDITDAQQAVRSIVEQASF